MSLELHRQALRRHNRTSQSRISKRAAWAIDILAYGVTGFAILFTFDQVRLIWLDHNAAGVSVMSWCFYTISASVWLTYGLIHKERALVIANSCWVVLNFTVALGAFLYA